MKAFHYILVDNEVWYCPHCGRKIDVEEYEKLAGSWSCACGRTCELSDDVDEVFYS